MAEQKLAIRRLVRGADGRMKSILVDLTTYLPITDLTGYRVVEAGDNVEDVEDVDKPDAPKPVEEEKKKEKPQREDSTQTYNPPAKEFGSLYSTSATQKFPPAPKSPTTSAPKPTSNVGQVTRAPISDPIERADMDSVKAVQGGFGIASNLGPNRPNTPSSDITNRIGQSVVNTFGEGYTIDMRSGQETDKNKNGRIDNEERFGSHRHGTGKALDFDVLDPTGKQVTDTNKLNDLAADFAYNNPNAGIGFGEGYMSNGRMHLDVSGAGGQWGAKNTNANMDPVLSQTIDAAREGYRPTPFSNAPTPTNSPAKPGAFVSQDERLATGNVRNAPASPMEPRTGGIVSAENAGRSIAVNKDQVSNFVSQDEKTKTGPSSVADKFVSQDERYPGTGTIGGSAAKEVIAKAKTLDERPTNSMVGTSSASQPFDLSKATPAQLSANGYTQRTPAELGMITKAIAGELGPAQLKELQAGNPTARQELANIVATMENRAGKTGSIGGVLQPQQYNSLMDSKLGTTNKNLELYGTSIAAAVSDYYAGKNQPVSWDLTHYYNPSLVAPEWGAVMQNPTKVGDHLFGSIPQDYKPNKDWVTERNRLADAQVSDTRGWTPDLRASASKSWDTPSPNSSMSLSDQYKSYGEGRSGGSFGSPSPNSGMSMRDQYSSYGAGRDSSSSGRTTTSGGGGSSSAHSTERERDTSLGGRSTTSGGFGGGGGSKPSSSSSSHSVERERDTSLGSGGGSSSKSPTNDGNGGKKSPGGGF